MEKIHLVIFGGDSYEHEISVISAIQAMKQYPNCKAIYIAPDGIWYEGDNLKELSTYQNQTYKKNKQVTILPNSKCLYHKKGKKVKAYKQIEDVLCVFHGDKMEGGAMASLFEQNGIPYSCSPMLGSAIIQSKAISEYLFKGLEIQRLPFLVINKKEYIINCENIKDKIRKDIEYPIILKPSSLGSSIGIQVVHNEKDLDEAITVAFSFDEEVLLQKYLENMIELNIAIYRYQGELHLSKIEQPLKHEEILSFADKYQQGDKEGMSSLTRILEPHIDINKKDIIEQTAIKVYDTLSLSGVVRFDYMVDEKTNMLYLNEVNNIPGSLAFYLFDLPYDELIKRLMIEAHKKQERKKQKEITFSVLSHLNGSKLGKLHK